MANILGREGADRITTGRFYVSVVQADPPVEEIPPGVSPPSGAADGGHGPQTLTVWDMGVPTHWGGAGNIVTEGDRCIYHLSSEHVRTINFDYSYHGLVSGGVAEAGNEPIQAMVGAASPGYPGDKGAE